MSKMENLNTNCFWSWIHKFHDTSHYWRVVSEDDCRAFPFQCWWEQQNGNVTCGPCWGQGTQNPSWKSSSHWADIGTRRSVVRAPQSTILAPRQSLCVCFTGAKYQLAKKSHLILLCQPSIILSRLYSKESNNSSFMLKVTGKQTSSFIPLKRLQQNVSWKSSEDWENHKPTRTFREHQLFSTATCLWSVQVSALLPPFCFLQHQFALHYKAWQFLHELCICLSSLSL